MPISTIISLLALGGDLFGAVSGIKLGKQVDAIVADLGNIKNNIQQISDSIFYAPNIGVAQDINCLHQKTVEDYREIKQSLEPFQCEIGTKILSSALIVTPKIMQSALIKNPWEYFVNIRPIKHIKVPQDPDMVAFSFRYDNVEYIGWQKNKILPQMFNLRYQQKNWFSGNNFLDQPANDSRSGFNIPKKDKVYNNADLTKIFRDIYNAPEKHRHIIWESYYHGFQLIVAGIIHSFGPKEIVLKVKSRGSYLIYARRAMPLNQKIYFKLKKGEKRTIVGTITDISKGFRGKIIMDNSKLV